MKVRIVCLRNTLTRTRRVRVCLISNAGNEVGREKKRAIIPQFSDQTHQTYRATWSGLNWKLGWWGREVRKVCVCVCVTFYQQGRQMLFVLCCFKESLPCLTHTSPHSVEPVNFTDQSFQSSVNRDVGSLAIRPHIWQSIDNEKETNDVCRQLDTPVPCLCCR